jgi:hypothetical protein
MTNPCTTGEVDVGRERWRFSADGAWHSVEEYVSTAGSGTVTVRYDGKRAVTTTLARTNNGTVGGVIFQTFYVGDATKWGPSVATADVSYMRSGAETPKSARVSAKIVLVARARPSRAVLSADSSLSTLQVM